MLLYVLCMPCCLLQGVPAAWHTWFQAWDAHPLCADVDWRQQCNITQDNPHAHQVTPSCIRYWTGQQLPCPSIKQYMLPQRAYMFGQLAVPQQQAVHLAMAFTVIRPMNSFHLVEYRLR